MKALDIVLIVLIAVAFVLALRAVIRNKKNGGCCGDCARCGKNAGCAQDRSITGKNK